MTRVKKTSSKRAPCWTAEEDAALREAYRLKLPTRTIAAQLGRTVIAVRRRAANTATARPKDRWTLQCDANLRELHASGLPYSEIASC